MIDNKYNATVVGKILITPDFKDTADKADEPRSNFKSRTIYFQLSFLGKKMRSPNSVVPVEDSKSRA
jgi:hypothetical protein